VLPLTNELPRKSALTPGSLCSITLNESGDSVSYEVIELAGRGANSETYLARDTDGGVCALKAALPKAGLIDEADLVIAEKILEQLAHKNLVRFLGSGTSKSGKRVLAYERVYPNPSLLLNQPPATHYFPHPDTRYFPLPIPIALSLAGDVFRGLEYMHSQGFVHHDVKPSNVMIRIKNETAEARVSNHAGGAGHRWHPPL
jgi:serine/threonine protein kinase